MDFSYDLENLLENNSTSSASSSSSNDSFAGGLDPFAFLDYWFMGMEQMTIHCHMVSDTDVWLGIKIFILVTSLPANAGLMWMLLSGKTALSASKVLGLNLSIMDILYCLCLPLDIVAASHNVSEKAYSASIALSALNVFGCPLLLTFMCVERYLAAARPVAYLRLRRWEYRAGLCACAWILTLVVALLLYFVGRYTMTLYLAVIITVLFLLMLLCLAGIAWVLCQSGPGEGSAANVPLKRRALKNILAVMVPTVVAYAPLVALVPFMAVIKSRRGDHPSTEQCKVLQVLLAFPNFGLYIVPMFYLSRVRQLACWKKEDNGQTPNSKTQAE